MPIATDTIQVSRDLHFRQISELCNIDIDIVKALNPQYRAEIVPGNWQLSTLRLPNETLNTLIDYKDSIYNYRADNLFKRRSEVLVREKDAARVSTSSKGRNTKSTRGKTITVKKGDTLGKIAKRNGISVEKLRRLNGLKGNSIRPGQKLRVE